MTILNDDHTEPHLTIADRKTGEILTQTFNFLDQLGGKQAATLESKYKTKNSSLFISCRFRKILSDAGRLAVERLKSQNSKRARGFPVRDGELAHSG